jgi:hypothetical protein
MLKMSKTNQTSNTTGYKAFEAFARSRDMEIFGPYNGVSVATTKEANGAGRVVHKSNGAGNGYVKDILVVMPSYDTRRPSEVISNPGVLTRIIDVSEPGNADDASVNGMTNLISSSYDHAALRDDVENINKKGVNRRVSLKTAGPAGYSQSCVETNMMTALVQNLDDLERQGFDSFIVVGDRFAFDLGSSENMRKYLASEREASEKEESELADRLKEVINTENLSTDESIDLGQHMLDNRDAYAAMMRYCAENADSINLYELDRADAEGLMEHVIPEEGAAVVRSYTPGVVTGLTENVLKHSNDSVFADVVDAEECSLGSNGRTLYFAGAPNRGEFARYVLSEEVQRVQSSCDTFLGLKTQQKPKEVNIATKAGVLAFRPRENEIRLPGLPPVRKAQVRTLKAA